MVIGVIVIAPTLKTFVEQRQQIASLQAAVDADASEIENLEDERERWNDSTFVMTQARDRLYYVNPGEISFIVINDIDPALLGDYREPVSDELTTTTVSWGETMLASIMSAGLAETVPAGSSGSSE
ncbi:hypothetical protein GCM10027416_10590 [Okibacterium endophyticum]